MIIKHQIYQTNPFPKEMGFIIKKTKKNVIIIAEVSLWKQIQQQN